MVYGLMAVLGIAAIVLVIICAVNRQRELEEKIAGYNAISIGDTKESVIEKLGTEFTRSVLKDGTEKLVWTLRKGRSDYSSYSYKGMRSGTSTYSGVKKCTVKFQNNRVVEMSGLNLEES